MMPSKQGSSQLHLQNVSFQDSGAYYCSVKEGAGMISIGGGTDLSAHVTDGNALSVFQTPDHVTPVKGTNVSMNCSASLFDLKAMVEIYWWTDRQGTALDPAADKRKIIKSSKQGTSQLHLLDVTFQDSGVYYCSVKEGAGKLSSGDGTEIIVHVPPTPVKIILLSSPSLTLLCTTVGFFPGEFNLSWYKDEAEITSGANTTKRENEEGLYQVSSSLNLVESWAVYTCQISHVSLGAPANDSYTVRDAGKLGRTFPYGLASGSAMGGLIFLVMMVLLALLLKRCKLDRPDGRPFTQDMPDQLEEQTIDRREAGRPNSPALNFRQQKKTGRPRREEENTAYSKTKHETNSKLTYAYLDFPDSQNGARKKQRKNGVEYAELKINKPSRESGVV